MKESYSLLLSVFLFVFGGGVQECGEQSASAGVVKHCEDWPVL